MKRLTIDRRDPDLDAMIERGTLLHGHLGPFLVVGIRMGLLALELLDSDGYFGLCADSEAGSTTPLSCLNDGVQIGSGCTVGKGNLTVTNGGLPKVRFATDDGRSIQIEVRPEIVRDFGAMEIRKASTWVRERPREELFTWKILSSP